MPTVLLTERGRGQRPSALPLAAQRMDYHDAALPGFMVRVTPNGVRTFAVWYRVRGSGEARRLTIGRVGTISLADAREAATRSCETRAAALTLSQSGKKARGEARRGSPRGGSIPRTSVQYSVRT